MIPQIPKKIRIMYITLSLGIGGLEKLLVELALRTDKGLFTPMVCCLSDEKDLAERLTKNGIKVYFLPKKEGRDFGLIFNLARLLKNEKIDIVHTHDSATNLYGVCAGKLAGVKNIINTEHGFMFIGGGNKKLINRILPSYNKSIACVSEAVRNGFIEMGAPSKKLVVIPNGVDVSAYQGVIDKNAVRAALGLGREHFVIASVGRLAKEKNQKLLLDAAKIFLSDIPNACLVIVGDGPLRKELEDYAQILGIQHLARFLGTRNDTPEILKACDCFVNTSDYESFGLAILEAMLCEVPVIATNVGGVGILVKDRITGLLIEQGDAQALAENIVSVYKSPQSYRMMIAAAKEYAQDNFDISKMVKNYENLYLECYDGKLSNTGSDLRVLHLISSGGLFGAEKVMLNLAEAINIDGCRSWVVGLRNTRNPHLEVIEEAKRRNIAWYIVKSQGRFDFGAVSSLLCFIKENNIGILHTHNYKANFIGLLAAKRTGIPIVATLHGYIGNGRKLRFYEGLDRFILRYFNKVILVDKSLKRWFRNGAVKYEVINNGVDIKEVFVNSQTRQPANSPTKLTIGTVGRLSKEKGHKYLIEAFAKLAKDYSNIRLLIVGDGDLRKDLETLSNSLGINGKVTFSGFQEDVEKYYSLMDIYASPSLLEHFPLAVLEAMSFGKAIMATSVGGVPKLIKHGETGMLIESGSAEQIEKALKTLITDKEIRDRLGAQAQKLVKEQYSVEKMAREYIKVYKEALSNDCLRDE